MIWEEAELELALTVMSLFATYGFLGSDTELPSQCTGVVSEVSCLLISHVILLIVCRNRTGPEIHYPISSASIEACLILGN